MGAGASSSRQNSPSASPARAASPSSSNNKIQVPTPMNPMTDRICPDLTKRQDQTADSNLPAPGVVASIDQRVEATRSLGSALHLPISRTSTELLSNSHYITRLYLNKIGETSTDFKNVQVSMALVCLLLNKLLTFHEVDGARLSLVQRSMIVDAVYTNL